MGEYILAIDQGTTGTTVVIVDQQTFVITDKSSQELPQLFPRPGWVEHNLLDIWRGIGELIQQVFKKNNINPQEIISIGITNQRETTTAFNGEGSPLANAIVWQDRRTIDYCRQLKPHEEKVKKISGLPIDPYFSATKMRWLLDNNPAVKKAEKENDLHFGTIDTFLLYKLTGNESYLTEGSNASRTLLMDLKTLDWDSELLNIFAIDKKNLPQIKDSFGNFGKTKNLDFLPDGIPITGILGDQQSALFGQAAYRPGGIKCTYGTGSFLLLNTGKEIQYSQNGLLTTVAYQYKNENSYALEGSCYIAGAAVGWLRDNLKIIEQSSQIEALAEKVTKLEEMENLLFLPFFSGIGSPYWRPEAKSAIVGMTRDTNDSHIARACLDGIALSINDLIQALINDSKIDIKSLNVDGGAAVNNLLMQIQADVSNLEIIRPNIIETTAFGAALASAMGNHRLSFNQLDKFWQQERSFTPEKKTADFYQMKKKQWSQTIKKLFL